MERVNINNKNSLFQKFKKNKLALWSLRTFYIFIIVALFGDFIANNKPIVCKIDGNWEFPIFYEYAAHLGFVQQTEVWRTQNWRALNYEFSIFPLIPYNASFQDRNNMRSVSPFAEQRVTKNRFRHILGTDLLGRDVAAGLVAGTRTAMLVGLLSMGIATLIGLLLGSFAGYFSDNLFQLSIFQIITFVLGMIAGFFIAFIAYYQRFILLENYNLTSFFISTALFLGIVLVFYVLGNLLDRLLNSKKITIPLDLIIMRLIEVINSIPTLLLLLAVLGIIEEPSVIYVMLVIGLIRWTGIAKFIRAELLKIRALEYIEAGRAMGFTEFKIMLRHAIPNALHPVIISFAFSIASAILIESSLSFLGIGVAPEAVTWGSMLHAARSDFSAWWLAVFPGTAIFLSVTMFNLIGEGLSDALNPK